jgi:hypothetical protein
LRIELNVKKANVCLHLDPECLRRAGEAEGNDCADPRQGFEAMFPATLAGAGDEGYKLVGSSFLESGSGDFVAVLMRRLDDEFLWSAASKLYFCQDLAIMIASFVREGPEAFVQTA